MFVPQRPGVVSYKQCAEDEDFAGTFDFYKKAHCAPVNVNDYVAAFYDEHWWVGLVIQFDTETNDVLIKFMAPHGPRVTFSWPKVDDIFWVPRHNIITVLETPTTSSSGRNYHGIKIITQLLLNPGHHLSLIHFHTLFL